MTQPPLARDAYEALADAFAAKIDTKPHNAYYEQPATRSLLPPLAGKRVLDAGCGPGALAEWLVNEGATVVAIDASPRMVAHATRRTAGRVDVRLADLAQPLPLDTASVDLVVGSLVMEYVRDWTATFREFHRVLDAGGHLVVSVTHPAFDAVYYGTSRYFEVESVSAEWSGFGPRVTMPSYRRSLEETLNPFMEAGFRIERLLEPRPTADFAAADPRHYAELMQQPCFLCIRAARV